MKALTWHGVHDVRAGHRPRSHYPGAHRRDHPRHLARGCADPICTSTRCSAPFLTPATSSATSRWASSRRWGPRSATSSVGDRVVIPFNDLVRPLLHVRRRAAVRSARPPRSTSRAPARALLRVLQALRAGRRRPGRAAAGAAGALRADQGARRPARRPLRVPLRRAPHRVAGRRRTRRRSAGRQPARARPRADRRDGDAHRPAPRRRAGDRPSTSSPSACAAPARTASRRSI